MEDNNKSIVKQWEDMGTDILVKILKELNMVELASVSQVCRQWQFACYHFIWRNLDLGLLKSNFVQIPYIPPYVYVDRRSDRILTQVLRIAMTLSRGSVTSMIFHFNLYMTDEHLKYIAERSPHLKRLVMPGWNRVTRNGISQAIGRWQELESMTMSTIADPPHIMDEISRSCKKFSELKIMGTFDMNFASAIATSLPKLKVLSLRCSRIIKEALLLLLNCMDNLEVLNISHCMLLESLPNSWQKKMIRKLDQTILDKASRFRKFIHCQSSSSCIACQRMDADEGLLRWYRYEDWFWRQDEVSSLNLGEPGKLFDPECEKMAIMQSEGVETPI